MDAGKSSNFHNNPDSVRPSRNGQKKRIEFLDENMDGNYDEDDDEEYDRETIEDQNNATG